MPYEKLTDLPDSVRDNLPHTPRRSTRRRITPRRSNTTRRTAVTELPGARSRRSTRRTRTAGSGSRRKAKVADCREVLRWLAGSGEA